MTGNPEAIPIATEITAGISTDKRRCVRKSIWS